MGWNAQGQQEGKAECQTRPYQYSVDGDDEVPVGGMICFPEQQEMKEN